MALQLHVELDTFMLTPSALVFVQGTAKLMNLVPFSVVPLEIFAEHAT